MVMLDGENLQRMMKLEIRPILRVRVSALNIHRLTPFGALYFPQWRYSTCVDGYTNACMNIHT